MKGTRDTLPLVIGAIPFGLIFGALSGFSGLSLAATMAMSIFVFAGSSQFIAISLISNGTAWPIIVLVTFVVNFRHLLYSATLLPHLKKLSKKWQLFLSFWLTDETFAVSVMRYKETDNSPYKHWYQLGSALFMYINWNICTFVGYTAGQMIDDIAEWGLDFAMPATFIGMVIPYLKNRPMWCAVSVTAVAALLTYSLPHKLGLIISTLLGIATGIILEEIKERKS